MKLIRQVVQNDWKDRLRVRARAPRHARPRATAALLARLTALRDSGRTGHGGSSNGGSGHGSRPLRARLRRYGALGGATVLAVVCSGVGIPPPLRPDPPPDEPRWRTLTAEIAAPTARGAPFLGVPQRVQAPDIAHSLQAYADRLHRAEVRRGAAVKQWKLRKAPLRAPTPPEKKPELTTEPGHLKGEGLPPVIVQVPTDEKVIFLTVDDGADKDPALLEMLRGLDVPMSGFLSDEVAREDYGYFREARRAGYGMHNHSITHRQMDKLGEAEQRAEICGQQDILEKELGHRPKLFRPPYGAYDEATLRAAAACGIEVVPLWAAEAFPDRIEYGRADRRFHPGDIVLTHFRGEAEWDAAMTDMVRRLLDAATEQGFAVARLEDYL
ncbi:polysaccharide deacetylase family protein [Streptomyces triticirhizae]|uniref:Polysaccharide deacetylase family protein n=1 Tax=Streptomyces triticirhizae TaxID=2483353 RepID=A0A3M2MEY4_9ACTN|nr:polysaccharide deacetylase family protein [Streptomyces triticirhizae]RMI45808.1 polysaccharide deacetylase family protein [Streptomyces triticirhizae]